MVVAKEMLDAVGLHVPLRLRAEALTVAQKHLLELAKALAVKPYKAADPRRTHGLSDQEATDMLFGRVRDIVKAGTSVIYITHRLAEVPPYCPPRDGVARWPLARFVAGQGHQRLRIARPDRGPHPWLHLPP